ncbi:hypothetical protein ECANGB1_1879 [Enterospora canceri]|uniref:Uncharacterized protein n=1 Tax=Enterospora canceri TaxID=1081671 RepID=A0A1Y1S9P8_9MICR|nr:hypothetical protein ECANGB1_1879 [Enterospora canceri]
MHLYCFNTIIDLIKYVSNQELSYNLRHFIALRLIGDLENTPDANKLLTHPFITGKCHIS